VAVSHTGAMAGTDRMYEDLFRRTGVIRAQTFGDLLDISAALATRRVLRGWRIASSRRRGTPARLCPTGGSADSRPRRRRARGSCAARLARRRPYLARSQSDRRCLGGPAAGSTARGDPGTPGKRNLRCLGHRWFVRRQASGVSRPELLAGAIEDCLRLSHKPVLAYLSSHAPESATLLSLACRPSLQQRAVRRNRTDPRHVRDALGRPSMLGTGGVTAGLFKDTTMRLLSAAGGFPRSERWPWCTSSGHDPCSMGFAASPRPRSIRSSC